jgi:hypothetical protein
MENEANGYDVMHAHITVCIKYIVLLNVLKVGSAVIRWILKLFPSWCEGVAQV